MNDKDDRKENKETDDKPPPPQPAPSNDKKWGVDNPIDALINGYVTGMLADK